MKKIKQTVPFLLAAMMLIQGINAFAQDEKQDKVRLKVIKNDTMTVDTTLMVTTGADGDELKKMIQEITGMEDLAIQVLSSGDLEKHGIKMIMADRDSMKRVAVYVRDEDDLEDIELIEEDEMLSVSKVGVADHHIIVQSGKGEGKVYAIISGDKMDMDDVEEIVIKKKDGNVFIMKGDEIQNIKGDKIYLKTSVDDKGSYLILPDEDHDGMVIVKKDVKVIKKEGEQEIEIIIMQTGKEKEAKEVKKEKAEKEKK